MQATMRKDTQPKLKVVIYSKYVGLIKNNWSNQTGIVMESN